MAQWHDVAISFNNFIGVAGSQRDDPGNGAQRGQLLPRVDGWDHPPHHPWHRPMATAGRYKVTCTSLAHRPAADCPHDDREPGAGDPDAGGPGGGRRREGRPGLADRRRGPGDDLAAAPAGVPLVRAPGQVADVHAGPGRRGQGSRPPVHAGGPGPLRRGVFLDRAPRRSSPPTRTGTRKVSPPTPRPSRSRTRRRRTPNCSPGGRSWDRRSAPPTTPARPPWNWPSPRAS